MPSLRGSFIVLASLAANISANPIKISDVVERQTDDYGCAAALASTSDGNWQAEAICTSLPDGCFVQAWLHYESHCYGKMYGGMAANNVTSYKRHVSCPWVQPSGRHYGYQLTGSSCNAEVTVA